MPYTVKKSRAVKYTPTTPGRRLVTFDEFYERVDEKTRADLLDGVIIRDSPAIPRHGRVVSWIFRLIGDFAERFDLGEVLGATTTVRLTIYNAPEPDVFFISKKRLGIIQDKYVNGPPDICVEVISTSSRKHDRGRKFVLYAESGVKEYWIIDPFKNSVEFFENIAGEFVLIQPDEQGRLHSKILPGFWLNPGWQAAEPLPRVMSILQEILGAEQRLV
jgi:Uma2 family endonuclease